MARVRDRAPPLLSSTQRILGALLGVGVVLLVATLAGALFIAPPEAFGPGMAPHPEHPSMLRAARGGSHAILGWGYTAGLSILALMTVCVLLGVAKQGRLGRLGLAMLAGCVGLALVFTALVAAYDAADTGDTGLIGGFPPATAWMLYGIWGFPALLLFGLSAVFRRVWLTEKDVERFRRALANRQGGADGDGGRGPV